MHFDVAGPFEIPRFGKKKIITKESLAGLKELMEAWRVGLSDACGCYVFAKRAGGGITPWYVGQACARPMIKEALNSDNIAKYNKVLDDKGTPLLFALPAITPGGKLRKPPKSGEFAALNFLERWLIATALDKNGDLVNNKETMFLRRLHVVGIFNALQGEATADSQSLSATLW